MIKMLLLLLGLSSTLHATSIKTKIRLATKHTIKNAKSGRSFQDVFDYSKSIGLKLYKQTIISDSVDFKKAIQYFEDGDYSNKNDYIRNSGYIGRYIGALAFMAIGNKFFLVPGSYIGQYIGRFVGWRLGVYVGSQLFREGQNYPEILQHKPKRRCYRRYRFYRYVRICYTVKESAS